jgi:hypothetical protein
VRVLILSVRPATGIFLLNAKGAIWPVNPHIKVEGLAVRTASIRSGVVVYDVADPHRHGIVNSLNVRDGRFVAKVRWIDTWLKGDWMPVADLRRVRDQTPSQPVLPKTACNPDDHLRARRIHYGWDDGGAVVFNLYEAWWCYDGEWKPMSVTEAVCKAGVLTEEAFHREFGSLPPLPDAAFRSGWRSPLV